MSKRKVLKKDIESFLKRRLKGPNHIGFGRSSRKTGGVLIGSGRKRGGVLIGSGKRKRGGVLIGSGKRKPNKWVKFVKKVHNRMLKKNKNAKYASAIKSASKMWNKKTHSVKAKYKHLF